MVLYKLVFYKKKSKPTWSHPFAYAVGLITTDGSLSKDGRHIDLTSKDVEQLKNFKKCLGIEVKIGKKYSSKGALSYRVQFGDIVLYDFLVSIGLTSAKTKTLKALKIPQKYFFDFLRGHFDGDGSSHFYRDSRWGTRMFYLSFVSASRHHIDWLQREILRLIKVKGHITSARGKNIFQLKYAKNESIQVISKMYQDTDRVCLRRKKLKIKKALSIMRELNAQVL